MPCVEPSDRDAGGRRSLALYSGCVGPSYITGVRAPEPAEPRETSAMAGPVERLGARRGERLLEDGAQHGGRRQRHADLRGGGLGEPEILEAEGQREARGRVAAVRDDVAVDGVADAAEQGAAEQFGELRGRRSRDSRRSRSTRRWPRMAWMMLKFTAIFTRFAWAGSSPIRQVRAPSASRNSAARSTSPAEPAARMLSLPSAARFERPSTGAAR